jgi:hypothetical protein
VEKVEKDNLIESVHCSASPKLISNK